MIFKFKKYWEPVKKLPLKKKVKHPLFVIVAGALITGLITLVVGIILWSLYFFGDLLQCNISSTDRGKINVLTKENSKLDDKIYESDFEDNKWTGIDKFIITPENIFQLPKGSSGEIAWFKQEISESFVANLSVYPYNNTRANIVFQVGNLYRIIVGDGDYKYLSTEKNIDVSKIPAKWKLTSSNDGNIRYPFEREIKPNSDIKIRVETTALEESNKRSLLIKLWYFPKDIPNSSKIEQTIHYDIELPHSNNLEKVKIGIGLLDPQKTGKIGAKFFEFTLEDKNFE